MQLNQLYHPTTNHNSYGNYTSPQLLGYWFDEHAEKIECPLAGNYSRHLSMCDSLLYKCMCNK